MKLTAAQLKKLIRVTVRSELNEKKNLSEAMNRITAEEVDAWKKGDWGFVSEPGKEAIEHHDSHTQAADDSERFLHGYESGHPHDDEGYMLKSNLYSMKEMAEEVCELVKPEDQLPGWVQDLLAVAHENLSHVHRYLTGDEALRKYAAAGVKESKLNESHNRITKEEMDAWMRGEWGFVSEDSDSEK